MQLNILGYGPITSILSQELNKLMQVRVFSSQSRNSNIPFNTLPYTLIENTKFSSDDVFILAFKGLPQFHEMRGTTLEVLTRKLQMSNTLINLSSVSIYGNTQIPATENQYPSPVNNYGISKFNLEKYLNQNFTSKVCQLRISNVFGDERFTDVVNTTIKCAIESSQLKLYSPNEIERNFISISTVTKTIKYFVENADSLMERETYNVCSSSSITLETLKLVIEEISGRNIEVIESRPPIQTILTSRVSGAKFEKKIGVRSGSAIDDLRKYAIARFATNDI